MEDFAVAEASFLPSEIARLVLGYLMEEKCMTAYNEFLNTSKHLEECRGRRFFTTIMGMTLTEILDAYCAIHALVININTTGDLSMGLTKCINLVDKVAFLIQYIRILPAQTQHKNVADTKENISPIKHVCSKTPLRRNSCDSIFSVRTEKSHKCCLHSPVNKKEIHPKEPVVDDGALLNDNVIESTKLTDLPGVTSTLKDDVNTKDINVKGKNLIFNDFFNSIDNQNLSLKTHKRELSKSCDGGLNDIKPCVERNDIDFRHALGLIKQTDIDKFEKTPLKKKIAKQRNCVSARKSNNTDNFSNETFDIATITNVLLDCTELHEKLAESINKINNSSINKTDIIDNSPSMDKDKQDSLIKDLKKVNDPMLFDFDTQMENIIKSIVEDTTKDPIFDQLLNDVIAASRENASGSESEALSRPETSTPEKSSMSNACSPVSSHSYDMKSNSNENNNIKHRLRSWKTPKSSHKTKPDDKEGFDKSSTSTKNCLSVSKKYPRRPRGGKKMDILKASYDESPYNTFDSNSKTSEHDAESLSNNENHLVHEKPEPKVIILSNEKVNRCDILNDNFFNKKTGYRKFFNNTTSTALHKISSNISCNNQVSKEIIGPVQKLSTNIVIHNGFIHINNSELSTKNDVTHEISQFNLNEMLKIDNVSISKLSKDTQETVNRENCFKISGKPPELIISKCQTVATNKPQLQISHKSFTEAEIMDMPTVFMDSVTKPAIFENDNSNLHTTSKLPVLFESPSKIAYSGTKNPIVDIKIFDSKGIDVFPSASNTTIPNSNVNVLGNEIAPKPKQVDIESSAEDGNLIIYDQENSNMNVDSSQLVSVNESVVQQETNNMENANESSNNTLKTPDVVNKFQKLCSSTPSKKHSHVRVLDFNTPEKSSSVHKRKAFTSPKNYMRNRRRVIKSDKIDESQDSKISLFPPILEESPLIEKNLIEDNKKDTINNVDILEKVEDLNGSKIPVVLLEDEKRLDDIKENVSNIIVKVLTNPNSPVVDHKKPIKPIPYNKRPSFGWDRDLRAFAVSNDSINDDDKDSSFKKKRRDSKNTTINSKCRKKNSIAADAKLLEDALLDKSQEKIEPKTLVISDSNGIKINTSAIEQHKSKDDAVFSVMDDLELSTNTTIDDQNMSQKENEVEKNNSNLKNTSKILKSLKKRQSSPLKKSPICKQKEKLVKLDKSKIDIDHVKINAIPLGKAKKNSKVKGSTFKVKLGAKAFVDNQIKKSDSSLILPSKIVKNDKCESVLKKDSEVKKIANEFKSPEEAVIPDSHITPELPKEYRSNPINVKCNLNSLLETPCKPFLMDITMSTPRFLSPHHNEEPVSAVKMFADIPTPNFSISKNTVSTPGSPKLASYSSGSSYYLPDEIDSKNILTDVYDEKNVIKSTSYKRLSSRKASLENSSKNIQKRKLKRRSSRKLHQNKSRASLKSDACYESSSSDSSSSTQSDTKSKTVENNDLQTKKITSDKNGDENDTNIDKVHEKNQNMTMKDRNLRELEEKRQRTIARLNETEKNKKKPVTTTKKNLPRKQTLRSSSTPVLNKEKVKKTNAEVTMPPPKVENAPPRVPDKPDDRINKRKSFTPRKMLQNTNDNACDVGESYDKNLLGLLSMSLNSQQSQSSQRQVNADENIDKHSKDNKEISHSMVDKNKSNSDVQSEEVDTSKTSKSCEISSDTAIEAASVNMNVDTHELVKSADDEIDTTSSNVSEKLSEEKTSINFSIELKDGSENVSSELSRKSNEESSQHEKPTKDEDTNEIQEPYVDFTWSKYEGLCIPMVYDSTQKRKKKVTKKNSQDKIDLENMTWSADIFDNEIEGMRTVSSKTTQFFSLLDIPPYGKSKKKTEKKESQNKSRPLQLLIDEMSNSTTESLSPIKQFESNQTDQETVSAVKSILPDDRSPFVDSTTSTPIKIVNPKESESCSESMDNTRSLNVSENDDLMDFATTGCTDKTPDKRKRDDDENTEPKKPKCEKSVIDIKNIDIEQVLCEMHGY